MPDRVSERQLVALRTESANHADRYIAEIRAVPECFARVHVGQVEFDKRYADRCERIAHRHAGVRISRRVDDDEIDAVSRCLLYALDELGLRVALECRKCNAGGCSLLCHGGH